MDQQEVINCIALTRTSYLSLANLLLLYRELGSATAIMNHRQDIREVMPLASERLVAALRNLDEPLRRAEAEMRFIEDNDVIALPMSDPLYPQRLRECDDAPIVMFYKGTADLNRKRVISVVGTRHATAYGDDLVRRLMGDLRQLCPEVLIVSGLAYGIDISAHRHALQQGMDTVAVLAHGLDTLYPSRHRQTADTMLAQGGLLTEYLSGTNADKGNFVRRNRIVAGLCDACLLVESAAKGGGLITCGIARDYNRDVFAFPGHVGTPYSEGCNRLIRDNGAMLVTSAQDLVEAMGWQVDNTLRQARQEGIERSLFPELSADEQRIVDVLKAQNDLQINMISVKSEMGVSQLAALLFSMEMKGIVKPLAGGAYHLLM
ncbi:MAG: DNA-processing protein DprA [Prevotella sp.]|nr:DNA-processing protein DprA [Prevotella sp.]